MNTSSNKQVGSLSNNIKFIAIAGPIISIIAASLYYHIFFSYFEVLSPDILSVSDYFDKAVSIFTQIVFPFAFFIYLFVIVYVDDWLQFMPQGKKGKIIWSTFCTITFISMYLLFSPITYKYILLVGGSLAIIERSLGSRKWNLDHEIQYAKFLSVVVLVTTTILISLDANRSILEIRLSKNTQFVDIITNGALIGEDGKLQYIPTSQIPIVRDSVVLQNKPRFCSFVQFQGCKKESTPPK